MYRVIQYLLKYLVAFSALQGIANKKSYSGAEKISNKLPYREHVIKMYHVRFQTIIKCASKAHYFNGFFDRLGTP